MDFLNRISNSLIRQLANFSWQHPFSSSKQILRFLSNRSKRLCSAIFQIRRSGFIPDIEIHVLGGLGDSIVATRWVKEFMSQLKSEVKVSFYSSNPKQLAWLVQLEQQTIKFFSDTYLPKRPNTPRIQIGHQVQLSSGKIENLRECFISLSLSKNLRIQPLDPEFNEQVTPILGRQISQIAISKGLRRNNYIFSSTGLRFPGDSLKIKTKIPSIQLPETYITLHNGYDENFFLTSEDSTKNYQEFQPIVDFVQENLGIPVIQVGLSTTSKPLEVAYNLLDRTNLQEVGAILDKALLHIDVESGLVHLAASLGTRCVVIFGPTPWEYFGYPTNINLFSISCTPCWWLQNDWMNTCHRSANKLCCTKDINFQEIIEQIITIVN